VARGIPERWGYATDARGALLTRSCRVSASVGGRSQVYYYRAMLEGLGLPVSGPPDASLACPEAWAERGRALLGSPGPWIGINPGAAYGTAKRWPPERFAAAAALVARRSGAQVAIVGSAAERPLAEQIAAQLGGARACCAARRRSPSSSACCASCDCCSQTTRVRCTSPPRSARRSSRCSARPTGPRRRRLGARARRARGDRVRAVQAARVPDRPPLHGARRGRPRRRHRAGAARGMSKKPAIFLDRDGTLSHEVGYVNHPSRFRLYPWSVDAVRAINRASWLAVVVTNQAGVARGYFPESVFQEVQARLRGEVERAAPASTRSTRACTTRAWASRRTASTATAASRGRGCCAAPRRSWARTCAAPG
jgi:hypothetical protein